MKATVQTLAWYIERDGATVTVTPDGGRDVRVAALGGFVRYYVHPFMVEELDRARDVVYGKVMDKRRAAALRGR